jgi:hypothetical protein
MKMTKYVLMSVLTGAAVLAQGPMEGGRGPGRGFGPGGVGPGGFGLHGGKVVTNAPYSADVSFSRTVTMLDGNTIQNSASGKFARDTQGRTYSMETFTGGPLGQNGPTTRISIFDPVAGFAYELDPTAKTAVKRAIRQHPQAGAWPGPKADANRPAPPDVVKTDMGTQIVSGVSAQGTKSTRTIPAGAIGNTMPIVSTTETWYSAALQTVVSSKHSDPRAGQTTYALTNIVQGEPAATLFQVPSGYTVKDAPGPRGGRGGFGPPGPPPQEEE